jgi:DNA-binding NarL/FixJ family response regulator
MLGRRGLGTDATEGFLAACWDTSAGNPFLLVELFRALAAQGVAPTDANAAQVAELASDGMARSIVLRLQRLGQDAIRVARAVAVLEPDAQPEHIAAVSGLPAPEVTALCEQLIAAHLLTDATRPDFAHPLVKQAVYRDTAAPRRGALHLVAARTLDRAAADSGTVAAHLLRCPPARTEWVVQALRQAARDARARGAPTTAAEYLKRALAEPPPADQALDVRQEFGAALLEATDARGIDELLAVRSASEDPIRRGRLALRLSESLGIRARIPEAVAMLAESLAEVGDDDPDLVAYLLGDRYAWSLQAGLPADREGLLRDVERCSAQTPGGRHLLCVASMFLFVGLGRHDELCAVADRVAGDLDLVVCDGEVDRVRPYFAPALAASQGTDEALAFLDAQLLAASRRDSITSRAMVLAFRAIVRLMRGDLAEADSDATTAFDLVAETGMAGTMPTPAQALMVVRAERGELASADALIAAHGLDGELQFSAMHGCACFARGRLRSAMGRHEDARADFLAAADRLAMAPYADPVVAGWRPALALAEFALGREEEARAVAAEAVRGARESGYQLGIARALRVQGMIAGADGIEILREAAQIAASTDSRLEQAHALVELGAALRRAKHRSESREPLLAGLDLAHRCGARPLEERARTELAASGARPRTAVLSGVESLTPSELRVARLVADGHTNREVAQELFVTVKTVETQLGATYRKLDISGRGDLPAALAR